MNEDRISRNRKNINTSNGLNKNERKKSSNSASSDDNFNIDDINEDNPSLKEVVKFLKKMHKALSFVSDSHHDFKITLKNLEDENKILKVENIQINKRLSKLESEFFNQQQQTLQNDITLHGLPSQNDDEIKNTIIQAAHFLKVPMSDDDITSIRTMNNTSSSPIVVIRLRKFEKKCELKNKYKQNGPISLSQIYGKNTNKQKNLHQ